MTAPVKLRIERWLAVPVILIGALVLRLISGVGFVNYDTLYALAWGGQLARGQTPAYDVAIAPTPHPLIEAIGVILYPLGPRATEDVVIALGFIALSACGWVIYRLGTVWFGARRRRARGASVPDPRAGALLRGARIRGHPVPAAGPERPARRVPAAPRAERRS